MPAPLRCGGHPGRLGTGLSQPRGAAAARLSSDHPATTYAQQFAASRADESRAALQRAFLTTEGHSVWLDYPLDGPPTRLHAVGQRAGCCASAPRRSKRFFFSSVTGSGGGLYMVKEIVENEGGRVEIRSELAVSSTFAVYLPCPPSTTP